MREYEEQVREAVEQIIEIRLGKKLVAGPSGGPPDPPGQDP